MGRLLPILFFSLFFVVSLGFLVAGVQEIALARATATWPTTPGTIVTSSIRRGEEGSAPLIEVRYAVNGKPYTNDTIRIGLNYYSSDPNFTNMQRSRYKAGRSVLVAYDPNQPDSAVLEPGVYKCSFKLLLIGLLFLHVPAGFLMISWLERP